MTHKRCLIAYFSRRGNNYVSGQIVNLAVGNTEIAAGMIQEITGGDLFHIEAAQAYPEDYTETTEVARQQLQQASGEIEQYQNLLTALQQRGVELRGDQATCSLVAGAKAVSKGRFSCRIRYRLG